MRADIYNLSWLGVGVGLAKTQWGQEILKWHTFVNSHTTYQLKNKEQKFPKIINHQTLHDSNESS